MAGPVPEEPSWAPWVTVSEDRALAAELVARYARSARELGVPVTDLLGPRRAFWRRFGAAAPIAEQRRVRMELGRSWHQRMAQVLPDEGRFEVRVRRLGMIGRIDLLADVPVEVKTGTGVAADRIATERPEHVEQLAIYCLLADQRTGRIVYLAPGPGDVVGITAHDLGFADPDRVRASIRSRREGLLEAMRTVRPDALPACRWFGRGCEFQEARVCDCTGSEPPPPPNLLECVTKATPRPDVEARWADRFKVSGPSDAPRRPSRFRDLLYPRRSYFLDTAPSAEPAALARPAVPITPDLYERLMEAIEGGPVGDVARLAPRAGGPDEEVVGFRERPFLVRTSRAWSRVDPVAAVARFPQYALELGFRCATTRTDEGVVAIAYERAESDTDRIQVLRYRFHDGARFSGVWDARAARLREAIDSHDPMTLPACPSWMYADCPYRGECGCGAEPDRSQR